MKITSGIDLIEIDRIQQVIDRHGPRFLTRVFTPAELVDCAGKNESLAGRFAAKEAVVKALGCGIGRVGWKEVEIRRGAENEPLLNLFGNAAAIAAEKGFQTWSISLSHSRIYAIAMAVAVAL